MMYDVWDVESGEPNGYYSSDWYIRIVEGVGSYWVVLCVDDDLYSWDIDDNEYQLALVEAMLSLPCITSISIFTSYSVKSIEYVLIYWVFWRSWCRVVTMWRSKYWKRRGIFDGLIINYMRVWQSFLPVSWC